MEEQAEKRKCFVVMGFGVKTDFATGRKLDLDKSYKALIKPVVEEKGLTCVRADEIRHSGSIDRPMYHELLTADIVIADLSTANPNALYELGIRHALRPRTTIVVSENELPYPFDLNHISIASYRHLGDVLDFDEVMRFRAVLGQTIDAVLEGGATDSPVYTFLRHLIPPTLADLPQPDVPAAPGVPTATSKTDEDSSAGEVDEDRRTLSALIQQGEQALADDRFRDALVLFRTALQILSDSSGDAHPARDAYLTQRLVLATCKATPAGEVTGLREAMTILERLAPATSNDPETVKLAAICEERLFRVTNLPEHLERAIAHAGRAFALLRDRGNGARLAFLLNVRAAAEGQTEEEQIADFVWARRTWREVLALTRAELERLDEHGAASDEAGSATLRGARDPMAWERRYWALATLAEAHLALDESDEFRKAFDALRLGPADWMWDEVEAQVARLRAVLEAYRIRNAWV